jgi:hypothetical protein
LDELARWSFVAAVALLVLYLTGLDQGAVSQSGNMLHELMHDGRHLLGFPCH